MSDFNREASNSRPVRVVIAGDTFPPDINGAARFAGRLASGLAKRGNEVHVIAPAVSAKYGTWEETYEDGRFTVHRIKSYRVLQHKTLRFIWPFTLERKTDRILRDIKPDAVHIQSHLIVGRYLLRSAKKLGIRTIATNHIMPENLVKYSVIIPTWFEKTAMKLAWRDAGRILRKVDFLTTPTRRAAKLLEDAAGVSGVLAISCGIDASKFADAKPTTNLEPRMLFLGRLDYEKQVHVLIEGLAKVPSELGAVLEIVGDGAERESLEKLAKDLGIGDRVIFRGHISDDELAAAYERCTVFTIASIAELQSIATMEAMATGRPVIAADAMALPHLVHNGDNGYLFPPGNSDILADRLTRVFRADQEELDRMSDNSLHLISAHDIQRTLEIFEGLYRGDQDGDRTSDDNLEGYSAPIGRLSEALRAQVRALRLYSQELRERAAEAREEVRERFDDVREEVKERIEDVRDRLEEARDDVVEKAKAVDQKVRKTVKRATKRLKGDAE